MSQAGSSEEGDVVEHIVLFKLKPESTPEQKARMISELKALRERVPGIVDLSVGTTFSDRSQGFEVGLVVRFTDRAALEGYLPHPAHRACVEEYIHPVRQDTVVVDYEIEG